MKIQKLTLKIIAILFIIMALVSNNTLAANNIEHQIKGVTVRSIFYIDSENFYDPSFSLDPTTYDELTGVSMWANCYADLEEGVVSSLSFWYMARNGGTESENVTGFDRSKSGCRSLEGDGTLDETNYLQSEKLFNMEQSREKFFGKSQMDFDLLPTGVKVWHDGSNIHNMSLLSRSALDITDLIANNGPAAVTEESVTQDFSGTTENFTCYHGYILTGIRYNYRIVGDKGAAKIYGVELICHQLNVQHILPLQSDTGSVVSNR